MIILAMRKCSSVSHLLHEFLKKRLPILEIDGVPLPQSKAIERYVAKQVGLMEAHAMEEAQIDAVCEHQVDMRQAFAKVDSYSALQNSKK